MVSQGSFGIGRYNRAGDISASHGTRLFALAARLPKEIAQEWWESWSDQLFKILLSWQRTIQWLYRTLTYPFDLVTWILTGLSCLSMILALSLFSINICQRSNLTEDLSISAFEIFASSLVPIIHEPLPQQTYEYRLKSR